MEMLLKYNIVKRGKVCLSFSDNVTQSITKFRPTTNRVSSHTIGFFKHRDQTLYRWDACNSHSVGWAAHGSLEDTAVDEGKLRAIETRNANQKITEGDESTQGSR